MFSSRLRLVGIVLGCISVAATGPADAQTAVGRMEGSATVSPTGAPQYTLPIRVTEGINGLTPRLAVVGTGGGERGLLGTGFSLAGLSMIAPCRKTVAQDGPPGPVRLDGTDRFCLDGARLRLVSGSSYGGTNSAYRTEVDQLSRVTSLASTGTMPGHFLVETRDGLRLEYGNSGDSKLMAGTHAGAPPMFWALNKVSDRSGNSVTYHYDTSAAQRRFRPSHVLYTASNAGGPRYRIDFVYQGSDRPDPVLDITHSTAGGAWHEELRLLERIDLKHDGVVYRRYRFAYTTGGGINSRLNEIRECAVEGSVETCLAPTQFGWQAATAGHAAPTAAGTAASVPMPLDINGDGFEDLVWAEGGTWRLRFGGATGLGSVQNTGITATNAHRAMPLDWNGDGRMDLLVDWSDARWRVLQGTASGFSSPVAAGPGGIPSNTASSDWTVADTNGDGLDELLRIRTTSDVQVYRRLNALNSGFGAESLVLSQPWLRNMGAGFAKGARDHSAVRRPDFDGDGRDDLLLHLCEFDQEFQQCVWWGWYAAFATDAGYQIRFSITDGTSTVPPRYGDFNGDGLDDIIHATQLAGRWCIGFSQGGGGVSLGCGPNLSGYSQQGAMTGDYDGDGLADVYLPHTSSGTWHVFRSTGNGLSSSPIATGVTASGASWLVVDYNGDSQTDLVSRTGTGALATLPRLGQPGDLLQTVTDSFGGTLTFGYLPMSNTAVYTKGSGAAYPLQDVQSSWPLVRTVTMAPAGGISYTLTYSYANARRHLHGRGFLGMGSRTVTDSRNGIHTTETYRQDFPFVGALATATTRQPPGQATT